MVVMLDPAFHMWFGIILTVCAFYFFAHEKIPLEVTSIGLLTILLLFGHIFPLFDENDKNMLDAKSLLLGFANPSLIAVLALLVIGQGMVQTAALTPVTNIFLRMKQGWALVGLLMVLFFVAIVSAILNNTPLVILAIPVMQALSARLGYTDSRVMIPLSFAAILGGMMTLVGSSTNMLVSSALSDLGHKEFEFFDFTVPGAMMAAVGMVYVILVLPRLLPDRVSMARELHGEDKQFIAELEIKPDSKLIDEVYDEATGFEKLPDVTLRMVQRRGQLLLPPFEDYSVQPNDLLIVAATRKTLMTVLSSNPGFFLSEDDDEDEIQIEEDEAAGIKKPETHVLAEIMVPPASRIIDMSVEQIDFKDKYGFVVLGIQRRARVVRRRLGQMRLEAGDVLLIAGENSAVEEVRNNRDLIVLSGSRREIPITKKAPNAGFIFLGTIVAAATGFLSITVAAVAGAVGMIISKCLTLRQATRAIDRKIFLLVGSALALGTTLQATGGATYIADVLIALPIAQDPFFAAMLLFILVAIATNLLTNNACAILFTPIAVNLAAEIGVDPFIFAITVVFAANCSFASPIGYQTNLLVMGPGHYQFRDFMRAGIPLVIVMWITYGFVAKYYFGL